MKRFSFLLMVVAMLSIGTTQSMAQSNWFDNSSYSTSTTKASMRFSNQSEYTMTVKILYTYGGLYRTVYLRPRSSETIYFSNTNNFKLKIKATLHGESSYHNGGTFSITCNSKEWTEGEMTFRLSSYGSGLGKRISAREFESNN
jgi:hypothetical protein